MAGARNLNLTFSLVVISKEPLELFPEVVATHNNVTKVPRILYETFILLAITNTLTVRLFVDFVKKSFK